MPTYTLAEILKPLSDANQPPPPSIDLSTSALTIKQRLEIAIKAAKTVCTDPAWNAWANAWLDGSDVTADSAKRVQKELTRSTAAAEAQRTGLLDNDAWARMDAHRKNPIIAAAWAAGAAGEGRTSAPENAAWAAAMSVKMTLKVNPTLDITTLLGPDAEDVLSSEYSTEDVVASIRADGGDPEGIGQRGVAFVKQLLDKKKSDR